MARAYTNSLRERRHSRVRSKVKGTADIPRLAIFRSNRYLYAQIIDDESGKTLVAATSLPKGKVAKKKETMLDGARRVGKEIAGQAIEKKIKKVVFDRGGFLYAGKVKALADAAREGGLSF